MRSASGLVESEPGWSEMISLRCLAVGKPVDLDGEGQHPSQISVIISPCGIEPSSGLPACHLPRAVLGSWGSLGIEREQASMYKCSSGFCWHYNY